jgi:DNA-binding CsgD family transcriptional regulator
MLKQKVVIIHRSAIIQKGIAELLLHTCNISVSQFITDYSAFTNTLPFKKCVLFIDHELINNILNQVTELIRKGNSVYVIADKPDSVVHTLPYEGIFFIHDNLSEIQKKLNAYFPFLPPKTVEPVDLTNREIEVLKLVALGNSNKEIADYLSISVHTVISHRKNICSKLGIKTISGLTLYALINNLIN